MLKVAAFTGGILVPSARFRVRQYIPALLANHIALTEMPSRWGNYPPENKWLRPAWAGMTLLEQIPKIVHSYKFDVVLLQREMVSTFATLEFMTRSPRVLDVDDAIFLYRQGHFARRLAQMSDRIICGNHYVANWFNDWHHDIKIIPTAIDVNRYAPVEKEMDADKPLCVGWTGTSGNLKYLYAIEPALARVMSIRPDVRLIIMCDKRPDFSLIPPGRVMYLPWSEQTEVAALQGMDIGIMPLDDTEWAKGKCSFKMLQYMACGLPVVVSPVGMNEEVLALGHVGLSARSNGDWVDALLALLDSPALRRAMGVAGRHTVVRYFSVHELAPQLAACLH